MNKWLYPRLALSNLRKSRRFVVPYILAGGGAAYTVGILFYKSKGRYMHFVWHLFVLAGSVLQYFCVLLYCL